MPRTPNSGWFTLRYEILQRDEYTCRYCGRSAPSVPLEVDHVVAIADGGTDDPSNLVACCWSCNRGKEGLRTRHSGRRSHGGRRSGAKKRREFSAVPCSECAVPSTTIHIVPWCCPEWDRESEQWIPPTIATACEHHDPGGYWFEIQELTSSESALHWLRHLGEKRGRPDRLIADWIVEQRVISSGRWTLRCADCGQDRSWTETDTCIRCSDDICVRCLARHACTGTDDAPPSGEFETITVAELLAMDFPPPVSAMWNGRRNY